MPWNTAQRSCRRISTGGNAKLFSENRVRRLLPQVDAFLDYNQYFSDLPTYIFPPAEGNVISSGSSNGFYPIPLGLPYNLNAGITLTQQVFNMNMFGIGKIKSNYQALDELKLNQAQEEVIYQVALNYYQLASNQEKEKIIQYNLSRLSKIKGLLSVQVQQGFAKETDLQKLVVKTANLNTNDQKLQAGIQQQSGYLKLLIGFSSTDSLRLESDITLSDSVVREDMDQKINSTEREILERQQQLNALNERHLRADYYPKLQAFANMWFQAQRESFDFLQSGGNWYNLHQWGLRLAVPIMHGFKKQTQLQLAELTNQKLEYGLQQKLAQENVVLKNAEAQLKISMDNYKAQKANVDLAEKLYHQASVGYEQGTLLLSDYLDAEATWRESKMLYITSIYDYKIARLNYLKASGNLMKLLEK